MTPLLGPLRFPNVVFDLDGTLVNSLPGIEGSLRVVLARRRPAVALPPEALRPLIGAPLRTILRELLPAVDDQEVAALVAAYRAHYLAESCADTEPFPQAGALLADLRAAGARLFILTNKPRAQTEVILNHQGWTPYFEEVSCPDDSRYPFAHKAEGAVSLRGRRSLDSAGTLLVGDAVEDARAARAADWAFVAAGYGYGNLGGHGSSLDKNQTVVGRVADLWPLIFADLSSSLSHDHPEPLR